MRNSSNGAGGVGQLKIAPQFQNLPLLPYEQQLIGALDLTKEEYLNYRNAVLSAKYTRGKEYDLVPDVRNDAVTITVVQLVVGILLTAASVLLQKPPQTADEQEAQKNLKLQDKVGRQRFNQTQGIDVGQEVAKLGSTIPVIFGRYAYEERTGGIFAPAQLVWSRMLSMGNEQIAKCLFVLGEAIDQNRDSLPNLSGIYLGQAVAAGFTKEQIAIYWGVGRPRATSREVTEHSEWREDNNLLFGTRIRPESADPSPTDVANPDPFVCPINTVEEGPGFCQVITPTNNNEFGAYEPIRNGTTFKVDYQIVFIGPAKDEDGNTRRLAEDRRRKICGERQEARNDGQAGVGRGYSPLMGLVELRRGGRSFTPDRADWDYGDLYECGEGDEIDFYINDDCPPWDGGPESTFALNRTETDVEEMRGILERIREAADDNLQIGQMIMIGRTIWQVSRRSAGDEGVYFMEQRNPDKDRDDVITRGNSVTVTLKFVETTATSGATRIGLAGRAPTRRPVNFEGAGDPEDNKEEGFVPTFYYPLLKFKFGTYRNTRPVDVTEFGIESVVYNRASGLCNFKSLPSPDNLFKYDENNVNVREGRLSEYFERTSVFILQGRPITSGNDEPKEWEIFGEQYAVTGKSPVKMFNYIRVTHFTRSQMEFRLVPKTAADIVVMGPTAEMMQLDAANGKLISTFINSSKGYGSFSITTTGRYIRINDYFNNVELQTAGAKARTEIESEATFATSQSALPSNQTRGRIAAFYYELFGDPNDVPSGTTRSAWAGVENSRAEVLFSVLRTDLSDPQYIAQYGTNNVWQTVSFGQVRRGEGISTGAVLDVTKTTSGGNYFASTNGYAGQKAGYRMVVTQAKTNSNPGRPAEGNRNFDKYSQVAEVSHYLDLSKSCDSQPEHRISYINETLGNQGSGGEDTDDYTQAGYYEMQTLGLSVRSNNQLSSLNQVRVWLKNGISVERLATSNETGPSNLFPDLAYWLLTNVKAGLGSIAQPDWIDKVSFFGAAKYCLANKIHIDGAISDKVNIRQFLADQASMNLLNFSIANGKLALVPALPFDSNYTISGTRPVTVSHYFNLGNIIEGSYTASYVDVSERMPVRAVMIWRSAEIDSQGRLDSELVRYRKEWTGNGSDDPAMDFVSDPARGTQQTYDLSEWVSNRRQALMIGRYLLAQRQRVTHRINFKTTPYGISVAPATYIEINVPEVPTVPQSIGVIAEDGSVLSDFEIPYGESEVLMYRKGSDDVERLTIEYKNGRVENKDYWGSVFSSLIPDSVANTYLIEEVTIDEDGLVDITASHFPTNSRGESLIAKDVLDFSEDNTGRFFYRN